VAAADTEAPPATASVVFSTDYRWQDSSWLERREATNWTAAPMSIYEVHLGSWRDGRSYRPGGTDRQPCAVEEPDGSARLFWTRGPFVNGDIVTARRDVGASLWDQPRLATVGPGDNSVPFGDLLFRSVALQFFLVYELLQDERVRAIADLGAMLLTQVNLAYYQTLMRGAREAMVTAFATSSSNATLPVAAAAITSPMLSPLVSATAKFTPPR